MTDLDPALRKCILFEGISDEDIKELITCSGAGQAAYQPGQLLFDQGEEPLFLHVLLEGAVNVGKYYADGRQGYMTRFDQPGDIFGEILLFTGQKEYDFFARADGNVRVLKIPKLFLTHQCGKACLFHRRLTDNLMQTVAEKALFLQRRVQVLSGASLRTRLAKAILLETKGGRISPLSMNREEMELKYRAAAQLGLTDKLLRVGWAGLSAQETGRVGGMVAAMRRRNFKLQKRFFGFASE